MRLNDSSTNANRYRTAIVRQADLEGRFLPLLLYMVTLAFGLLQALILVHNGAINIGQLISYFGLLLLLDFPVYSSMWAYSQISLGSGRSAADIDPDEQRRSPGPKQSWVIQNPWRVQLSLEMFHFLMKTIKQVLEGISFQVKPGQTVAIVGQTGAGKTTLVKLVNRTYDVNSGQVLVDGIDVREWNLETLRQGISMIEQDIFLFSRSAGDNIAFGKQDATQDEIANAAKAAQADEFIYIFCRWVPDDPW